MHIEDTNDYNSKIFVDMMEALGLKQHITEPTTTKGTYWISFSWKSHLK